MFYSETFQDSYFVEHPKIATSVTSVIHHENTRKPEFFYSFQGVLKRKFGLMWVNHYKVSLKFFLTFFRLKTFHNRTRLVAASEGLSPMNGFINLFIIYVIIYTFQSCNICCTYTFQKLATDAGKNYIFNWLLRFIIL